MPRKGFFPESSLQSNRVQLPLLPQCGACGLFKSCQSPKMPVSGKGKKKILIVGEAPGADEDEQGKPFVGMSGGILKSALRKYGVEMRKDCWITNALICHPEKNRTPTEREIGYCRPNLMNTIKRLKPRVIITLGGEAVRSLIGGIWPGKIGGALKWIGWRIPSRSLNAWICPTVHPAYIKYASKFPVVELYFDNHIKRAVRISKRPWKKVPDYTDRIKLFIDSDKDAAKAILKFIKDGKPVVFDYEATNIKPKSPGFEIVCCAVYNGKRCIAFPWKRRSRKAMQKLLQSDLPKWGQNIKFEENATWSEFGHGVNNWQWDDMLLTHIYDNRTGITGMEFQSFAFLGMDSTKTLKPWLQAEEGKTVNRILSEIELPRLLEYCAYDTIEEYESCLFLTKELKYV